MNRWSVWCATFAALTLGALPAAAEAIQFRGEMGVASASTACGILPYIEQGNLFRAVYKPAGLGSNGPSSALSLQITFPDILVSSFTLADGKFGPATQSVAAVQVEPSPEGSYEVENYTAQLRVPEQNPATLTDATKLVALRMQIQQFGNVAGCTVTFRSVLSRCVSPVCGGVF